MGLFARFGRSGRTLLLPIPRPSWAGSGRCSGSRICWNSPAWWIGSAGAIGRGGESDA